MRPYTFDHRRPDLAPYGFTCELWKAAVMRRPDRHDEIELNLLLGGSLTYLLGGTRVTVQERRLGAFWAAMPHQIIGSEKSPEYFVITLPLAWVLQCQLPSKFIDRLLSGYFISETEGDRSRFELDFALCRQWEHDLKGRNRQPSPATALELQARLLRFAAAVPDTTAARQPVRNIRGATSAMKAEQMASYIARHYREPLSINDIARETHLHPNYAMTLFKRTFHTTLSDYLTRYRIAQAQRLLATTDEKVIDVALESGFRTPSRFYEAFQRACGCSPSHYRKDHLNRNPATPVERELV
ncbi:MAG: helix-turn-helix domain-containing protein [Verrucomicrobia subdivision 3 bacterium]|nr:helix-turn-helix domain-containing protein [Limisphaerales bacterium]